MQQRALVVLLVLATAVVFGATMFREQVADAAALLNVRVANSATDPVPVQQQGAARVTPADATELLLEDAFTASSGFRMIDVSSYRADPRHRRQLLCTRGRRLFSEALDKDGRLVPDRPLHDRQSSDPPGRLRRNRTALANV